MTYSVNSKSLEEKQKFISHFEKVIDKTIEALNQIERTHKDQDTINLSIKNLEDTYREVSNPYITNSLFLKNIDENIKGFINYSNSQLEEFRHTNVNAALRFLKDLKDIVQSENQKLKG